MRQALASDDKDGASEGEVASLGGDGAKAELLAWALDVAPGARAEGEAEGEDAYPAHGHGVGWHAGRIHPATARRLIGELAPAHSVVLDPFCGSGTVLLEAMLAGHDVIGTDPSPLAVLLAHRKTHPRDNAELEALVAGAEACAALADRLRKARAGATRRFPEEDVRLFEPHVLLELGSLERGIAAAPLALRDDLRLFLAAILVKVRCERDETTERAAPRRIAAGYTAKLFTKKAREWARHLATFRDALPQQSRTPRAQVALDVANEFGALAVDRLPHRPACIITAPPSPLSCSYASEHALRLRWLGLDPRPFEQRLLRARRLSCTAGAAAHAWKEELAGFFDAAARALPGGAPMVLAMAGSSAGVEVLRANELVALLAPERGFTLTACASRAQPRVPGAPLLARGEFPLRKHVLLLRRR